jgi:hypothetical protein
MSLFQTVNDIFCHHILTRNWSKAATCDPMKLQLVKRCSHKNGLRISFKVVAATASSNKIGYRKAFYVPEFPGRLKNAPLPTPRLQVNRGTCRFGRYKNPRRPHPRAVRPTNRLRLSGFISSPWSARPQWAPTAVSFLGCNA